MWKIAELVAGVDVATLDVTAIPSSYKHLEIRALLRSTSPTFGTFDASGCYVNGDNNPANYRHEYGQASNVTSSALSNAGIAGSFMPILSTGPTSNAADFANVTIRINDYANATRSKLLQWSGVTPATRASAGMYVQSGYIQWLGTQPINQLTFVTNLLLAAGSQVSVYGVKSAVPS